MNYVCSDIHGFIECYYNFFDYAHFSDNDTLYIIGDVLDRGSDGIKILRDIMNRNNVVLIKGNHEHMMIEAFEELHYCLTKQEAETIIKEELSIMPVGQAETLKDFSALSKMSSLK